MSVDLIEVATEIARHCRSVNQNQGCLTSIDAFRNGWPSLGELQVDSRGRALTESEQPASLQDNLFKIPVVQGDTRVENVRPFAVLLKLEEHLVRARRQPTESC